MCITRNTNNLDSCEKANKSIYNTEEFISTKNEAFKMITQLQQNGTS